MPPEPLGCPLPMCGHLCAVPMPVPGRVDGELDDEDPEPGDAVADAPDDDADDVAACEDPLAVEPPDVAAAAMPAPAASPATVTAPPMTSLRSIPADVAYDIQSPSLCFRPAGSRPPVQVTVAAQPGGRLARVSERAIKPAGRQTGPAPAWPGPAAGNSEETLSEQRGSAPFGTTSLGS